MEQDGQTPQAPLPGGSEAPLPSVSVLVMGHNQEDFIGPCIDSILAMPYEGEVEVILCDDCSTDATFDVMQRKAAEYKGPRTVIAHRCPVNGRVAVNMNVAVSLSHGDWLMRVDGDDIMHPDRLRLSMKALMDHPGAVAVCGQYRYFDHEYEEVENPADGDIECSVFSREDFVHGRPEALQWWGGIMTFSRRLFTEFGDMPASCDVLDDTMFGTRALMLGEFVIVRNACFIYYRRHGGNVSSRKGAQPGLLAAIREDAAMRRYYRRGVPCHEPILAELETRTAQDESCRPMLRWFKASFAELRRQAFFWQKSWGARIADAHITGPWWRKIPWAVRVLCPFTYVLAERLKSKRR